MAEYIDKEILMKSLSELCNEFDTDHLFIDAIIDEIDNSPTVDDVEPMNAPKPRRSTPGL